MYVHCGNVVGIRAVCEQPETTPKSGLYFEDLQGVTFQKSANYAEDKTGIELMQLSLREAQIKLNTDILFFMSDNAETYASGFTQNRPLAPFFGYFQNTTVIGEMSESFNFAYRNARNWKFTKIRANELYIKPLQDIPNFEITITDKDPTDNVTARVRTYGLGALIGGETNRIQLTEAQRTDTANLDFSPVICNGTTQITTNSLESFELEKIRYVETYCTKCTKDNSIKNEDLIFSGNNTFFVELLTDCQEVDVLCYAYNNYPSQLGELLRLRAGIYFFENALLSNRENFATQNLNAHDVNYIITTFREKYKHLKDRYLPNLVRLLKTLDKYCFQCQGWVQRQMQA